MPDPDDTIAFTDADGIPDGSVLVCNECGAVIHTDFVLHHIAFHGRIDRIEGQAEMAPNLASVIRSRPRPRLRRRP